MSYELKAIYLIYEDVVSSNNYIETALVSNNTIKDFRPLSKRMLNDLRNSINMVKTEEDADLIDTRNQILPDNVIYHNGKNILIWKHPGGNKTILFENMKVDVIFPKLVFQLEVNSLFVYAYNGKLKESTELRRILLPNFYDDCRLCLGNISLNLNKSSINFTMQRCESIFFDSKFSDHLFNATLFGHKDVQSYITSIKGKQINSTPSKQLKNILK